MPDTLTRSITARDAVDALGYLPAVLVALAGVQWIGLSVIGQPPVGTAADSVLAAFALLFVGAQACYHRFQTYRRPRR